VGSGGLDDRPWGAWRWETRVCGACRWRKFRTLAGQRGWVTPTRPFSGLGTSCHRDMTATGVSVRRVKGENVSKKLTISPFDPAWLGKPHREQDQIRGQRNRSVRPKLAVKTADWPDPYDFRVASR